MRSIWRLHALRPIAALALCLLFAVWALQQATAASAPQVGILWEVSIAGGQRSYLMGTVHSDDPRVLDLPGSVREAFEGADSFTAEIDMTPQAMAVISGAMFFQDQTELPEVIGKELYATSARLLAEYGLPEQVVRKIKPWAAVVTLSTPKATTGQFLDQVLYTQSVARGRPVYGLETVAEQVEYFDGLPMRHQVSMLRETVRHHNDHSRLTEKMIGAWLERDLGALERLNDDYLDKTDPEIAELFTRRFIVERNRLMLERMQPRLREGNAFIAVGALHLPGDQGLLRLLERRGYRVKAVY